MSPEEMFKFLLDSGLYNTFTSGFSDDDLSALMNECLAREENYRKQQCYFESEMTYNGESFTITHRIWELRENI